MPRRPRPTREKIRMGETRPSRVNYSEPLPPLLEPHAREDQSVEARAVWDRVLQVAAAGSILAADEFGLEAFSDAVVMYRRAMEVLQQTGPLIRGRNSGLVANPMSRVARDWQHAALAWSRELGLTPSARSSIRSGGAADPFADLWATIGPPPRLRVVGGQDVEP